MKNSSCLMMTCWLNVFPLQIFLSYLVSTIVVAGWSVLWSFCLMDFAKYPDQCYSHCWCGRLIGEVKLMCWLTRKPIRPAYPSRLGVILLTLGLRIFYTVALVDTLVGLSNSWSSCCQSSFGRCNFWGREFVQTLGSIDGIAEHPRVAWYRLSVDKGRLAFEG